MANDKKNIFMALGNALSGFSAPFLGDYSWQSRMGQLEQNKQTEDALNAYRAFQIQNEKDKMKLEMQKINKMYGSNLPVFTIDPLTGQMTSVGNVPRGSKVMSPTMLMTPEAKADLQVKTSAKKDEAIRNQKLSGLMQAVDFFEDKINEMPVGTGLEGRLQGVGLAAQGITQLGEQGASAAAYMADLQGMRSQIARGLGEVGNLSEYEQKYAVRLLPAITDNAETRIKKISNFRDYINKKLKLDTKKDNSLKDPLGLR